MDIRNKPVLVLGATGYIGGRLVPRLLEQGWKVRAVGRSERKIQARPWGNHPNLEIIVADALDTAALSIAMRSCSAVYYLIQSIRPGESDFATLDRHLAYSAVEAARAAGMNWFIHFSGLGHKTHLSAQLRSRYEIGEILALGGAKVTQLRAPLVLGSGGASFEMIRAFCGYLRIMFAPRWMDTNCQPIAITNVIEYLVGCLQHPETIGQVFQIGGPEVLTWRKLFRIYADEAQLPERIVVMLPLRIHRISIGWMNLVTPVSAALIRPLIERMQNEVLCEDNRIQDIIPQKLLTCREAITKALSETYRNEVVSSCFDAGSTQFSSQWDISTQQPQTKVYRDSFFIILDGSPELAWNVVKRIGGDTGWYFGTFLWRIRGFIDKLLGGPGLSRGRRHVDSIAVGDCLDFWRVVAVDEQHLLLKAEMLAPGKALLEFHIQQMVDGTNKLRMTPSFEAHGIRGKLYWLLIAPSHSLMFGSMLKQMAKAAGARVVSGPTYARE